MGPLQLIPGVSILCGRRRRIPFVVCIPTVTLCGGCTDISVQFHAIGFKGLMNLAIHLKIFSFAKETNHCET